MKKEDLRIAFISLQKDAERVPPLGLIYNATYLNKAVGIPKENIKIIDKNYSEDLVSEALGFNPDLIGISSMAVNYEEAKKIAKQIKLKKEIPIVIGGVHVSTLPTSMKKCFDVGVIGEGEETLKELIEIFLDIGRFEKNKLKNVEGIIYWDCEKIVETEKRGPLDIEKLPIPDFDFVSKRYFEKTEVPGEATMAVKGYLLSSRGCPYRCVFCSTARFWGKMRLVSPKRTAEIVEDQVRRGATYLQVMDDLFTISPSRLDELRGEFEKRGILKKLIGIDCTMRANLVNEKLMEAAKKIKIRTINFGFESGSDKFLKYLKVGTASVEMNQRAVVLGKKYGFNVYGSLMYGSPTETIEDMKKTNKFIDFCYRNGAKNMWSFVATPFPATPFWEIALERGKVSNEMNFDLLGNHNMENPLLLDPEISRQEFVRVYSEGKKKLRKIRLKLIKEFVLRNPLSVISLVIKEPKYYVGRFVKQIFKQ